MYVFIYSSHNIILYTIFDLCARFSVCSPQYGQLVTGPRTRQRLIVLKLLKTLKCWAAALDLSNIISLALQTSRYALKWSSSRHATDV